MLMECMIERVNVIYFMYYMYYLKVVLLCFTVDQRPADMAL